MAALRNPRLLTGIDALQLKSLISFQRGGDDQEIYFDTNHAFHYQVVALWGLFRVVC